MIPSMLAHHSKVGTQGLWGKVGRRSIEPVLQLCSQPCLLTDAGCIESMKYIVKSICKLFQLTLPRNWLCAWVPFVVTDCQDHTHHCPSCGALLGAKTAVRDEM